MGGGSLAAREVALDELHAALLARAHDAAIVWELGGGVLSFNRGAEALYGFTQDRALGLKVCDLLKPECAAGWDAVVATIDREGRWEGDLVTTTESGRRVCVESSLVALVEGGAKYVLQIDRDATSRKEAQTALEQADRHKNEFLAMLGHELRNPLAPIRAAVETLQRLGLGGPHHREMLAILKRQSEQLTRLVDDLLDVSRITFGKIELKRELVDITTVVKRAVETSRPLIEARGHSLRVTLPEAPIWVEGDVGRLAQAVANLLNNAAKYTETGGHVAVSVLREGTDVSIRVVDDGPGIPSHLLPKMFDLFAQGPRPSGTARGSVERAEGGLGVGLTLVRRLVQLHGGRVEGFCNPNGPGSTFIVRLPTTQRSSGIVRVDAAPSAPELPMTTPARLRILVVDDNVDAAESMAMFLELEGHWTRQANSGEDAIEIARTFRPDVVLLDIGLPNIDGYEVARRLRAEAATAGCRLIALTGYGQEEDRRRSWEAGFDGHLTKPVAPSALAAMIARTS